MKQHPIKNSSLRGVLFILLCIVGIGNVWGEKYKLITSTNELVAGCRYIIASMTDGSGAVMRNYVSDNNNWGQIETSATNSYITYQSGMARLTLGGSSESWTFHNGSYYLDATSTTSSNHLKGSTDIDKYNKFSISFSNKAATIKCKGKDKKDKLLYNSTSKIFSCYDGNQKAVYIYKEVAVSSLSISGTPTLTEYYVGDTPSAEGFVVTATYSDNSTEDVTASATWTFEPATIEKNTTSVKATANYQGESSSCTYDISIQSIANTEGTPYSVAEAYEHIDLGKGLVEEVYVKGTVSKVENYDVTSGTINYWISDDGTRIGQQFMCDGGLDIGNAKFNNINDLKLGTFVIVKGLLQKDGDTYKFATDNTIISKDESNAKTLSTIEINGTPAKNTYYVGDTPSVEGLTVTATYSDNSTDDVTEYVNWTFTPETIAESTTQIKATAEYHKVISEYEFEVSVPNTTIYELTPIKGGSNTYDDAGATGILINDVRWFATGNTTDLPWKIGGNNITKVDRDIICSTPVHGTFGKVVVSIGNTSGSITLNSLTLSVSDNANFTNAQTYKYSSNLGANKDYTFNITPVRNGYYKITLNVSVSGSNNKYYEFCGAKFYRTHTTTLTSAGYATFCLPYNATVPQGLMAYTASDKGDYIKLTAKAGGKIAAGEGVVLKGEENTYTFVATAESVLPTEGNLMVGVTENTHLTATDNAYMLVRDKNSGEITFSLLNADYTLSANKAYLKLEENDARKQISTIWDDNGTGIDEILNTSTLNNNTIYNLSGQRLRQRQKGLNIIDGKLVIE